MSAVLKSPPAVSAAADAVSKAPELIDGFHLVIDALKLNGIDTIFGLPGIPITDLTRMAQAEGMRVISFRHEQHAGNAAAAAGYLTQKPGICLTVSAPGFLNGLTALANATVNCFPMILISGSSEREIVDLQQGDYEEMDQLAVAKPLCKAAYRVLHAQDIGVGIARAIRSALSGRPGGVYLDLPAKLFAQTMDAAQGMASLIKVVDPAPRQIPAPDSVQRAMSLLKAAKRPLIVLGKGASYAQADADIRALVERTGIPYLPMSMAKGLLPDTHAQSASAARSYVLAEADVVMLVGARLNWLLSHGKGKTWGAPGARQFIQIDIAPTEMDSNVPIAAPLVGDIGSCVGALLAGIGPGWAPPPAAWTGAIAERKDKNLSKMTAALALNPSPMNFHSALGVIRDVIKARPDVMLVNEGANTLDFTRSIVDMYEPRKRLDVGTWGIMGIGMGFAVAAAVTTGKPVIAIEGDSAFGFSGMEVETICRYNLPVCVVVFNNNGVYRGTDVNASGTPDVAPTVFVKGARYDKMMEAFGGVGVHATTPAELGHALNEALVSGKPTLINAVIDETAGTESGRITQLNPQAAAKNK
jgi:oxalyl-CoA decarboxylase